MAFHVVLQKFEGKSRGRTVRFVPGQIIDDLQYDFGQLRPDGLNVIELSPSIQTVLSAFNEQYGVRDPVQPLLAALVSAGLIPVGDPNKGSILVGDGSQWVELPVGADDDVLTADSSATEGVDWKATSSIDELQALCTASEGIGDCVRISGPKSGTLYQVREMNPQNPGEDQAIGIVTDKSDPTHCTVITRGLMAGIYTGLVPGDRYFIDPSSQLTNVRPSPTPAGGTYYLQVMGVALDTEELLVNPETPVVMRGQ